MRTHLSAMRFLLCLGVIFTAINATVGAPMVSCQITVEAGPHDRRDVPVRVEILVPSEWAEKAQVVVATAEGKKLLAQLLPPALLDGADKAPQGMSRRVIWWILPNL